jgi:hypothetical protein
MESALYELCIAYYKTLFQNIWIISASEVLQVRKFIKCYSHARRKCADTLERKSIGLGSFVDERTKSVLVVPWTKLNCECDNIYSTLHKILLILK